MLTGFVIAGNTLLRPIVNRINRIPIDEETGEATYEVRLSVNADEADEAREALIEALEAALYPVADVEAEERGDAIVEIVATLVATAVVPKELNAVIAALEKPARRGSCDLGGRGPGLSGRRHAPIGASAENAADRACAK